jgi:penicillin-binding protein 2
MIEQYLKDSITEPDRKARIEQLAKLNLMPARIYQALRYRDSLIHAKDPLYLKEKGYIKIVKDTMGLEEEDETEALDKLKKSKQDEHSATDSLPAKEENDNIKSTIHALLPDRQKKGNNSDSIK